MSHPTKRLVLAYPPVSTPLSPPLGVTTLKGYLDQALPAWSSSQTTPPLGRGT